MYFGVGRHLEVLLNRIDNYFRLSAEHQNLTHNDGPSRGDDSLVVGVFGPWGCGKTTWIRQLLHVVDEREIASVRSNLAKIDAITIPVMFNAWQFEREEHLIIPLLKNAEVAIREFAKKSTYSHGTNAQLVDWLMRAGQVLRHASIALASGLHGEFTFGATLNARSTLNVFTRLQSADLRHGLMPASFDAYESLYFDFREHMRAITGRAIRPQGWDSVELSASRMLLNAELHRTPMWRLKRRWNLMHQLIKVESDLQHQQPSLMLPATGLEHTRPRFKLNFLFLIDDLDRCLPEKALEMLEAIKLFLEVPGCAFILAVDDELIERGILHRYRNYSSADTDAKGTASPITGAEYMEKIVHLPVHIPIPSWPDIQIFIETEYSGLLDTLDARARSKLLNLCQDSLPRTPRRIIRMFELLSMLHELARSVEGRHVHQYDPVLLARLVILQLFAPEIYRVRRSRQGQAFLLELQGMKGRRVEDIQAKLERNTQNIDIFESEVDRRRHHIKESLTRAIATALKQILQQRKDFDPRDALALDEDYRWSERLEFHYTLVSAETSAISSESIPLPVVLTDNARHPNTKSEKDERRELDEIRSAAAGSSSPIPAVGLMPQITRLPAQEVVTSTAAAKHKVPADHDAGAVAILRDPEAFVAFSLSEDPADWQRAISEERSRLSRRFFDDLSFVQIMSAITELPSRVTVDWIQTFGKYLTNNQLQEVYKQSNLLARLIRARDADQNRDGLGRAIEFLCRRLNPPDQHELRRIIIDDLVSEQISKDLEGLMFANTYLRGLSLCESDLTNAVFRNSDLTGVTFDAARITTADFTGARLWWASFNSATIEDCSFVQVEAHGCSLRGTTMTRVDLRQSAWSACDWSEVRLREVRVGPTWSDSQVLQTSPTSIATPSWWGTPRLAAGHLDALEAITWSPDGQRLASASRDRTVRIWDAHGLELAVFRGHTGSVDSIAWSPNGEMIASGSGDNTVRIWRADDGRQQASLYGHSMPIAELQWSTDSQKLLSGARDGIRMWDIATGRELARLQPQNKVRIMDPASITWLPNGEWLKSGLEDVEIWDVGDGQKVARSLGYGGRLALSPDQKFTAFGARNSEIVKVRDLTDRTKTWTLNIGESGILDIEWSPDGVLLAVGQCDGQIKIWSVEHKMVVQELAMPGLVALAFSPVGKTLAIALPNRLRIWSLSHGRELASSVEHQNLIHSVAWSATGAQIAAASADGLLRVWAVNDGAQLAKFDQHSSAVRAVSWSPDRRYVASGSDDTAVRIWHADGGQLQAVLTGHSAGIRTLAWSPHGSRLASGAADATIRIWDAVEGRELSHFFVGGESVKSICWSPDGTKLVVACQEDHSSAVWDVARKNKIIDLDTPSQFARHHRAISVAWSPDGETIAVGCINGVIRIHKASGGGRMHDLKYDDDGGRYPGLSRIEVTALTWSPDSHRLASAASDGTVRIWSIGSNGASTILSGHEHVVNSVAWSPTGDRLVTGGDDRTVRIWNIEEKREIAVFECVSGSSMVRACNGHFWVHEVGTARPMLGVSPSDSPGAYFIPLASLWMKQSLDGVRAAMNGDAQFPSADRVWLTQQWTGDVEWLSRQP